MRIKYDSKTYSFFFLSILLSIGLLFSSNSGNITFFNSVYSQKTDNASSLNNSVNNISNQQGDTNSSKIKQPISPQPLPPLPQQQQQQQVNNKSQFNHYENSQIGVSLKYPSNFLIDESKSNNTLRQISFYPVNTINLNPENNIQWMDVFVQTLDSAQQQQQPLLSQSNPNSAAFPLLSTNNFLSSYSLNLANNIQQANQDITILGSSTNTTLSGYPAYKLITTSYMGNSAIIDVLISTIVNDTIYSIDYQTQSSNYTNSLSDANKIIQSFKILSPISTLSATATTSSSSSSVPSDSSINNKNLNSNLSNSNSAALIPLLSNLLSSLKIDNIANNSTNTVNTLKNSISNSLNDVLTNPKNVIDKSISGSASILKNPPPIPLLTSPSDLSSMSSEAVNKACNIPFVSAVCNEIKSNLDSNINNNGKTNSVNNIISKNATNNIGGGGGGDSSSSNNNSGISADSSSSSVNTTINNNDRQSSINNSLGGIREGVDKNPSAITSSINNTTLDNALAKVILNSLVNQNQNQNSNSLSKILNGLYGSNSTSNNSSVYLNNSISLDNILLLKYLIQYLNFTTNSYPPKASNPSPVNASSLS
jgi:hypothetical protein